MTRPDLRWLCSFAVAVTMFPLSAGAQAAVSDEVQGTLTAAAIAASVDPSSPQQPISGGGLPRSDKILIGAVVGAAAGAVFGEYVLGRAMDMPHGPDMLIGAGIGAALGALIGKVASSNKSAGSTPRSSVTVVPVVSPSRKSLLVTLPLR